MQRASKTCPICRQVYARVTTHMHRIHGVSDEDVLHIQTQERERTNKLPGVSYDLLDLEKRFPNYLDVALLLIESHIPVYERTQCIISSPVRHLSVDDIRQRMINRNENQNVASVSSSAQPCPVTTPTSRASNTVVDVIPEPVTITTSRESGPSVIAGPSTSSTPSLRRSSRVRASQVSLDTSTTSDATLPSKKRRLVAPYFHSNEESTDTDDSEETTSHRSKYKEVNMYLSSEEQTRNTNRYVKLLENRMNRVYSRADSVRKHLSIAMKVMKFCAPDNDASKFHWTHIRPDNLNEIAIALKDVVKLKASSVTKFWRVIELMLREGEFDIEDSEMKLRNYQSLLKLETLMKANRRHILYENNVKLADSVYDSPEQLEEIFRQARIGILASLMIDAQTANRTSYQRKLSVVTPVNS